MFVISMCMAQKESLKFQLLITSPKLQHLLQLDAKFTQLFAPSYNVSKTMLMMFLQGTLLPQKIIVTWQSICRRFHLAGLAMP